MLKITLHSQLNEFQAIITTIAARGLEGFIIFTDGCGGGGGVYFSSSLIEINHLIEIVIV